ncbi:MAG: hypothetical protein WBE33_15435 [Planococcus citreus]
MTNSKVCFITTRNIFNTSCLPRYSEILKGNFDIIYWDQHGIDEECGAQRYYKFEYKMYNKNNKASKLIGYLKFKNYVEKIIKTNKYDKLIILPTQAGLLISNLLLKKYKNNYLIDIRDYSGEKNKLIYRWEKKLIDNSALAVITSPAYKKFLPPSTYVLSHNTTLIDTEQISLFRSKTNSHEEKIVVSCIGSIRFIEQFEKVIEKFKNDSRFELRFIGRGSEKLEDYLIRNSIENVKLIGRFESAETINYYLETDIIMNLYGNNNPYLDYALSNKLYYAANLGIPILVSPNTFMEEITLNNGIGIVGDTSDSDLVNKVYENYTKIDWDIFYKNCNKFIEEVKNDEDYLRKEVIRFLDD